MFIIFIHSFAFFAEKDEKVYGPERGFSQKFYQTILPYRRDDYEIFIKIASRDLSFFCIFIGLLSTFYIIKLAHSGKIIIDA